jgi:hypothetical protein
MHRRDFVTAGIAASTFLNLNPRAKGANEKVTLALIGGRNQGKGDATRAIQAGATIKTFCDLDEAIFAQVNPEFAKAQGGTAPGYTKDFRRVLDDKDIDGVIVATPDHWHTHIALQALSAGKDLYIEKPVTQTIYVRPAHSRCRAQVQSCGAGWHAAPQPGAHHGGLRLCGQR